MLFDTIEELRDYLAIEYPKIRGKAMACWLTNDNFLVIGVYSGDDITQGLVVHKDYEDSNKWILIDNLYADLAVRSYVNYIGQLSEAIELNKMINKDKIEDDFNVFDF